MPFYLLTPPPAVIEQLQIVQQISSTDDTFCTTFLQFCEACLDNEDLLYAAECLHAVVMPVTVDAHVSCFAKLASSWIGLAEKNRLGVVNDSQHHTLVTESSDLIAVTKNSWNPQEEDVLTVFSTIKLMRLLRPCNVGLPISLLSHPSPRIRYFACFVSTSDTFSVELWSPEYYHLRDVVVHGNLDSNGVEFPPIADIAEELEALLDFAAKTPGELDKDDVSQRRYLYLRDALYWSRHRLQVVSLFGRLFGPWATVAAVEENSKFFCEHLSVLCARACHYAASPHNDIVGIVNDIFCIFELSFLDMSLLPTPELIRQILRNLDDLIGRRSKKVSRQKKQNYRSVGFKMFVAFRSLQFSGGYLTRHEPETIAVEKIRLLSSVTLDDPFGRFAFTVSQSLEHGLANGLFDVLVKLLHRGVKLMLRRTRATELCEEQQHSASHSSVDGDGVATLRIAWERLNMVANLIDSTVRNGGGHPSVVPLVLLTHRSADDDVDLLELLLQLLERCPFEATFVLNVFTLCCQLSPRDCAYRFLERNVFERCCQVAQRNKAAMLATVIYPADVSPSLFASSNHGQSFYGIFNEMLLAFTFDALPIHDDTRRELQRHAGFVAEIIAAYLTSLFNSYSLNTRVAAVACETVLPALLHFVQHPELLATLPHSTVYHIYNFYDTLTQLQASFANATAQVQWRHVFFENIRKRPFLPTVAQIKLRGHTSYLKFCDSSELRLMFLAATPEDQGEALPPLMQLVLDGFGSESTPNTSPAAHSDEVAKLSQCLVQHIRSHQALPFTEKVQEALLNGLSRLRRLDDDDDSSNQIDRALHDLIVEWATHIFTCTLDNPDQDAPPMFQKLLNQLGYAANNPGSCHAVSKLFVDAALRHPNLRHHPLVHDVLQASCYIQVSLARCVNQAMREIKSHGISKASSKKKQSPADDVFSFRPAPQLKRDRDANQRRELAAADAAAVDADSTIAALTAVAHHVQNTFFEFACAHGNFAKIDVLSAIPGAAATLLSRNSSDLLQLSACLGSLDAHSKDILVHVFTANDAPAIDLINLPILVEWLAEQGKRAEVLTSFFNVMSNEMERWSRSVAAVHSAADDKAREALLSETLLRYVCIAASFSSWQKLLSQQMSKGARLAKRRRRDGDANAAQESAVGFDDGGLHRTDADNVRMFLLSSTTDVGKTLLPLLDRNSSSSGGAAENVRRYISGVLSYLNAQKLCEWKFALELANFCPQVLSHPLIHRLHFRTTAERVFLRLRAVPAITDNHVTVDAEVFESIDTHLPALRFPYLVDLDLFFAEMQRILKLDVTPSFQTPTAPLFHTFLQEEVLIVGCCTSQERPRCFAALQTPPPLSPGEIECLESAKMAVLTLAASSSCGLDGDTLPALSLAVDPEDPSALFNRLQAMTPSLASIRVSVPNSEDSSVMLQRGLLTHAEDIYFIIMKQIKDIVDEDKSALSGTRLSPSDIAKTPFGEKLSRFNESFDHVVRAMNCGFAADYLRNTSSFNTIFRLLVEDLNRYSDVYGLCPAEASPATSALLYCLRVWSSGPFLPKHANPTLYLDAFGNPVEDEDDDDEVDDDSSNDSDDAVAALQSHIEQAHAAGPEALISTSSHSHLPQPESLTSPPRVVSNFPHLTRSMKSLFLTTKRGTAKIPERGAAPHDLTPYHYAPPPRTAEENDLLFYAVPRHVSVALYVTTHAKLLNYSEVLSQQVFTNIALVAACTAQLRDNVAQSLMDAIEAARAERPSTLPILYNCFLSTMASFISGVRRQHGDVTVEFPSEQISRRKMVNALIHQLSLAPTFYQLKLVSIVMRILAQTQYEPSELACSWGCEHVVEGAFVPPVELHEHSLTYQSVGDGSAPCSTCRSESFFYHFACSTCRAYSCCTTCYTHFISAPSEESKSVVYTVRSSLQRRSPLENSTEAFLAGSTDSDLSIVLTDLLKLIAHPSFPCERIDGAALLVEAVFAASAALHSNSGVQSPPATSTSCCNPELVIKASQWIFPPTQRFLSSRDATLNEVSDQCWNRKRTAGSLADSDEACVALGDKDDLELMQRLLEADLTHFESTYGFLLHQLLPVIVAQTSRCRRSLQLVAEEGFFIASDWEATENGLSGILTQMLHVTLRTLNHLSPIVATIKNRDVAFTSSPANVLFFAACAKAFEAVGSDSESSWLAIELPTHSSFLSDAEQLSRRDTTVGGGMQRSETAVLLSETLAVSPIFKLVVPHHKERSDVVSNRFLVLLSAAAVKQRALLNFYVKNCENPSQALDSGLSYLIDASHLDFGVREKLFRSRLDERSLDRLCDVEVDIKRGALLDSSWLALKMIRDGLLNAPVSVRVTFDEEEGVDEGGLSREWVMLFFQAMCGTLEGESNEALLTPIGGENSECYDLRPGSKIPIVQFELLGVMIGLALTFNIPIEPRFARHLYKHMSGRSPSLADLEVSDPELHRTLLLVNRMTTEEEFESLCQTFTYHSGGSDAPVASMLARSLSEDVPPEQSDTAAHACVSSDEIELVPNGSSIYVTFENRKEYIRLVADYVMTKRNRKRIKALLTGVSHWFPLEWLTSFSAEELELVCSGLTDIDVEDWRTHTIYEGYLPSSPQVRWFWELMTVSSNNDRARVLQFVRGCAKAPASGFASLKPPFKIVCTPDDNHRLPSAHTCHNQLDLPLYQTADALQEKLRLALDFGSVGFGLA